MLAFLTQRLLQLIPTLFFVSVLIFGLQQLLPGDPALQRNPVEAEGGDGAAAAGEWTRGLAEGRGAEAGGGAGGAAARGAAISGSAVPGARDAAVDGGGAFAVRPARRAA